MNNLAAVGYPFIVQRRSAQRRPALRGRTGSHRCSHEHARSSSQDARFLKQSVKINYAAVDAGKLILQKSTNDRLKQIATTVVDTHSKLVQELQQASASEGVQVSDSAGPEGKSMCDKLQGLTGPALDKQLIEDMVKLHTTELHMYQAEASRGRDESLRKLSQDEVPILQQHLLDLHGIQNNER